MVANDTTTSNSTVQTKGATDSRNVVPELSGMFADRTIRGVNPDAGDHLSQLLSRDVYLPGV